MAVRRGRQCGRRYELRIGFTGRFGKSSELYTDVKYAHSLGGDHRRTVFGQVGYRFSW